MIVQLGITTGLTLAQTRELFSVPKQQFDLKSQVIVVGNLAGRLLLISRGQ